MQSTVIFCYISIMDGITWILTKAVSFPVSPSLAAPKRSSSSFLSCVLSTAIKKNINKSKVSLSEVHMKYSIQKNIAKQA